VEIGRCVAVPSVLGSMGSNNLIRPKIVDVQRHVAELSPCFSCLCPVRRRVSNNSPGTGVNHRAGRNERRGIEPG
jgi:hypothetical protein